MIKRLPLVLIFIATVVAAQHLVWDNYRFVSHMAADPTDCQAGFIARGIDDTLSVTTCEEASPGSLISLGSQSRENSFGSFYIPLFSTEIAAFGSGLLSRTPLPIDIRVFRFYAEVGQPPGTGKSWEVSLVMAGDSPFQTLATCIIADNSTSCEVTGLNIFVSRTSSVFVSFSAVNSPDNSVSAAWFVEAEVL